MKVKRIGVLTGGGDCPGLNAVLRAVVKSAAGEHGIRVTGFYDGYDGLVTGKCREFVPADVSGILPRGGTILGTSNTADPFRFAEKTGAGELKITDRSDDALRNVEKLGIDVLIAVGGDGTLNIASRLMEKGIPVIGIPKTIDNDLDATDITFGFDSALSIATEAVDRLHTTAEAHHRIMVLEVMGRYAGWIALRAGIAGGGDVILIPEIPYRIGSVCAAIEKRLAAGKRFSIVVVAEGAKPEDGEMSVQQTVEGSPDPLRLGGIGQEVVRQLALCSHLEARATVLGHLQRGGIPTAYDRWLATRFGVHAVELALRGDFGRMVALHGQKIESVTLEEAITRLRRVRADSEEVRIARSVGTSFGD